MEKEFSDVYHAKGVSNYESLIQKLILKSTFSWYFHVENERIQWGERFEWQTSLIFGVFSTEMKDNQLTNTVNRNSHSVGLV